MQLTEGQVSFVFKRKEKHSSRRNVMLFQQKQHLALAGTARKTFSFTQWKECHLLSKNRRGSNFICIEKTNPKRAKYFFKCCCFFCLINPGQSRLLKHTISKLLQPVDSKGAESAFSSSQLHFLFIKMVFFAVLLVFQCLKVQIYYWECLCSTVYKPSETELGRQVKKLIRNWRRNKSVRMWDPSDIVITNL